MTERIVLLRKGMDCANEVADCSAWNRLLRTPKDSGMGSVADAIRGIQSLEIRPIVGHEDAALIGSECQLLSIRYAPVGASDLVYGDGVDSEPAQSVRDPIVDIFV